MAEPIRPETDEQRRQRELAASQAYADRVARDPEMTQRIAEDVARINAHGFDENDAIPYETMLEMIRRLGGRPPGRPAS